MKYVIGIISALALLLTFAFCFPISQQKQQTEYLRIHIRANSNEIQDQNVKYKVKEAVVDALIPLLADIETFDEAKIVMQENFPLIEKVANDILTKEGFLYTAKADIDNEFFPTRTYQDLTLEEGYYDALILRLGSGEGDNWWCLVYPAFCFTKSSSPDNVVYISKIWEMIESWF